MDTRREIIGILGRLTPEQLAKVHAFVGGLTEAHGDPRFVLPGPIRNARQRELDQRAGSILEAERLGIW